MLRMITTLFISLLFTYQSVSSELSSLASKLQSQTISEDDQKALDRLGINPQNIGSLDELKNNIKKTGLEKQRKLEDGLSGDAVPGLSSSIVGLGFSTFLGITLAFKCYNQPSAIVFSASSGYWAARELLAINNYKIDIQRLKKIGSLQGELKNITPISNSINRSFQRIKNLSTTIFAAEGEYKEKLRAQRKAQVKSLRAMITKLKSDFDLTFDDQVKGYNAMIEALETLVSLLKYKVKNAKIVRVGMGSAAVLALAESFNLLSGGGGACVGMKTGHSENSLEKILGLLISSSYAGKDVDKVFAQAQENIYDFDKIGIPIGGALAGAYLLFKGKFLNPILSSGIGRSLIFGVMGAMAQVTYNKLSEAAKNFEEEIYDLKLIKRVLVDRLVKVNGELSADHFMSFVEDKILPFLEKVEDSVESEGIEKVEGIIEQVKDADREELIEAAQDKLEQLNEDGGLESEVKEKLEELNPQSFFESLFNPFISNAYASVARNCFKKGRRISLDPTCSCLKSGSCRSYKLPRMSLKKNYHWLTDSLKHGSSVVRAANYSFSGNHNYSNATIDQAHVNSNLLEKRFIGLLQSLEKKKKLPGNTYAKFNEMKKTFKKMIPSDYQEGFSSEVRKAPLRFMKVKEYKETRVVEQANYNTVKGRSKYRLSPDEREYGYEYESDSIEKDTQKNLFKIISRRYNLRREKLNY